MNFSKSERINLALDQMGINSVETLLAHLPRHYNDFTLTHETNLKNKERVVIYGRLVSNPTFVKKGKLTIIRFSLVTINNNFFRIVIFNRPYLYKTLNFTDSYTIVGNFDANNGSINVMNIVKGQILNEEKYKPIYSLPSIIENYQFSKMVQKYLLDDSYAIPNVIPPYFQEKYRFLSRKEALKKVHLPKGYQDVYQGLRVLKYEECLMFCLQTQIIRKENKTIQTDKNNLIDTSKINEFIKGLGYKLTHDQVVAIREIILDMNDKSLMYRLLQGDVGTGKTLVANIALFGAFLRGDQGVLMAPTDSLAHQHFETLSKLFEGKLKVGLLVGGLSNHDKKIIKEKIEKHEVDIVVGTHALFSSDVKYHKLGLAVIDEQHKFGVNQRLMLASKGDNTDLLLMSATPIPRTLALTLYGDLDVSTLSEYPILNRKIITKVLEEDEKTIYKYVDKAIEQDKRVFVVCPLIESCGDKNSVEQVFAQFEKKYAGKVSLLHGKLDNEEKEEALEKFKRGETPIVISTTVIEVGIDVKNASLMIIYDANNFGLASLHQIRGRIGRDGTEATCLLVYKDLLDEEIEKLKILESTLDGFEIAEKDLELRGPGDMNGLKQSGIPNFMYVNLISDFKMFEIARNDAKFMLTNNNLSDFKPMINKAYELAHDNKFHNV